MASVPDKRDADLIARCRAGESDAFRGLVERHQEYAYALAFRMVCDENRARDIVQESFIRAWRHLDRFDASRRFTTWLYAIIVHAAYDDLRGQRRRQALFVPSESSGQAPGGDPLEAIANRDLAERIRGLTGDLPAKQRMVFVLRDLQDLSVEETAETLGISESSVKANLSYARRRIRERMERILR